MDSGGYCVLEVRGVVNGLLLIPRTVTIAGVPKDCATISVQCTGVAVTKISQLCCSVKN